MARKIKNQYSDETYTENCDSSSCEGFQVKYLLGGFDILQEHGEWLKNLIPTIVDETGTELNLCVACEDAADGRFKEHPYPECQCSKCLRMFGSSNPAPSWSNWTPEITARREMHAKHGY